MYVITIMYYHNITHFTNYTFYKLHILQIFELQSQHSQQVNLKLKMNEGDSSNISFSSSEGEEPYETSPIPRTKCSKCHINITYDQLVMTLDTLPISEQLDLHSVLKKKLYKFSTKGIKTILLKYHPQYLDIIDDIYYIRPYHYNRVTGIATEPKIVFENNDTIYFTYQFGNQVHCYSKNQSGEIIPFEVKDQLQVFGLNVYRTLINADIIDDDDDIDFMTI
jgi:hypothetical protein